MSTGQQPEPLNVVVIGDEIKTPPMSAGARHEVGQLLRLLENRVMLGMPHSRPMPSIGPRCHELRVRDGEHNWRLFYRIDANAIVVAAVFAKKTRQAPKRIINLCQRRFRDYDQT